MMENDDKLIKNFMLAYKHEIEDNGFSHYSIFSMALKFYARQSVT